MTPVMFQWVEDYFYSPRKKQDVLSLEVQPSFFIVRFIIFQKEAPFLNGGWLPQLYSKYSRMENWDFSFTKTMEGIFGLLAEVDVLYVVYP